MKSIVPKPIGASKGRPPNVIYPVWPCLVGAVGPDSSNWKFLVYGINRESYIIEYFEKELLENFGENEDKKLVLDLNMGRAAFPRGH